jgi:RND family efflux transporter MFP subunit
MLLALVGGCSETATEPVPETSEPELETIQAAVVEVQMQPWPSIVRSQGNMVADEQTVVGSKVAGRVAKVLVDIGSAVEAGDPIVILEENEFRLQVAQFEAQLLQARSAVGLSPDAPLESLEPSNSPPVRQEKALLDEAKSNLQRATNLKRENAISQGEFDAVAAAERVAEARYAASLNSVREKIALIGVREADLALANQQLDETTIRAPMRGIVASRNVAPGTFLAIGQTVASIVRTDPLRFRGTVPERYAQSLAIGQPVTLKIESIPEPRNTEILRISPTLDQRSRALGFEAEIENSGDISLRGGLFAEAQIVVDSDATAMAVPITSVTEFAGAQNVWRVEDGIARQREVLCGPVRDGMRQIISGLEIGDKILLNAVAGRVARVISDAKADVPVQAEENPTASQSL